MPFVPSVSVGCVPFTRKSRAPGTTGYASRSERLRRSSPCSAGSRLCRSPRKSRAPGTTGYAFRSERHVGRRRAPRGPGYAVHPSVGSGLCRSPRASLQETTGYAFRSERHVGRRRAPWDPVYAVHPGLAGSGSVSLVLTPEFAVSWVLGGCFSLMNTYLTGRDQSYPRRKFLRVASLLAANRRSTALARLAEI